MVRWRWMRRRSGMASSRGLPRRKVQSGFHIGEECLDRITGVATQNETMIFQHQEHRFTRFVGKHAGDLCG